MRPEIVELPTFWFVAVAATKYCLHMYFGRSGIPIGIAPSRSVVVTKLGTVAEWLEGGVVCRTTR